MDIDVASDKKDTMLGKLLSNTKDKTVVTVTVELDNKQVELPLIVPTISPDQISKLAAETGVPQAIIEKAFEEALETTKKKIVPAMQEAISGISLDEKLKGIKEQVSTVQGELDKLNNKAIIIDFKFNAPYGFDEDGNPRKSDLLGKLLSSDGDISTEMKIDVKLDDNFDHILAQKDTPSAKLWGKLLDSEGCIKYTNYD
jgi:hypothetical protein